MGTDGWMVCLSVCLPNSRVTQSQFKFLSSLWYAGEQTIKSVYTVSIEGIMFPGIF